MLERRSMTDLITEARELCEKAMALEIPTERLDYSTEYVPLVDAIHIIPELCDALETTQERIALPENAIERQNNTIAYLHSTNEQGFNW